MIIYKTTNLLNGKIYVGQDSKNNPNYLGSGKLLNKAINKYGIENFKKEIIEDNISSKEKLNEREIYWIAKLQAITRYGNYNILPGGKGGDLFTNNPNIEEIKKKMSNNHADVTGEKNPNYGKHPTWKLTEENKNNMRKPKSTEHITSMKNYWANPENKEARSKLVRDENHPRATKVYQYDLNYNLMCIYLTIKEFSKNFNVNLKKFKKEGVINTPEYIFSRNKLN